MFDFLRKKKEDTSPPYLVQRLSLKEAEDSSNVGLARYFKFDDMGAVEFSHFRIYAAMRDACIAAKREKWFIESFRVNDDVCLWYLGPSHRLEGATSFAATQFEPDNVRAVTEHPLKERTYMKESFYHKSNPGPHYCGWWRIDSEHQFFLFKAEVFAQGCLDLLKSTDLATFEWVV